jgi:Bacterial Ig domain
LQFFTPPTANVNPGNTGGQTEQQTGLVTRGHFFQPFLEVFLQAFLWGGDMQKAQIFFLGLLWGLVGCSGGGTGDTTTPSVSLSASSINFTTAGNLTLTATASDDVGVTKVEFFEGASKLGEDTTAADGFVQTVAIGVADNGTKSYTAKAFDAAGNTTTSSAVAVTVLILNGAGCPVPAVFDNPACVFDNPDTKLGP